MQEYILLLDLTPTTSHGVRKEGVRRMREAAGWSKAERIEKKRG